MEQVAFITVDKLDELLAIKNEYEYLDKFSDELLGQNEKLKRTLLETNLEIYHIEHYSLEECTNIGEYAYGLKNRNKLLKILTLEEMNKFITEKFNEFHKESQEVADDE